MNKPNLFNYATSELSQDAMICWLLEWAEPQNKSKNKYLHECGQELIKNFFKKANIELNQEIETIEIFKQSKNIDVFVVINYEYAIIIEDKTHTKNHSNQLQRYIEDVNNRKYELDKIIPIYFKTHDQSYYEDIKNKGYYLFLRNDLLKIMNSYPEIKNDIFLDFKTKIENIEKDVESYNELPIEKWHWSSWIGFYKKIQSELNGNWDYVSNKNGGFLGFWWNFIQKEDYTIYVQLEHNKLCFKIRVEDKSKRYEIRKLTSAKVCSSAEKVGLPVKKPARFGKGLHMTIAVITHDYRITNNNDLVNISKTIDFLNKCSNIIKNI